MDVAWLGNWIAAWLWENKPAGPVIIVPRGWLLLGFLTLALTIVTFVDLFDRVDK